MYTKEYNIVYELGQERKLYAENNDCVAKGEYVVEIVDAVIFLLDRLYPEDILIIAFLDKT